ncbi:MAG: HEAT repeat domain-containing protein, partial [Phycisphaerae bacterium]|nr:HEAT repeat domain-containing protein [Phycisphaerae bacterium]
ILKDEKYYVRWNAARALGKIRTGGVPVYALTKALKDNNIQVRRCADDALGAIGSAARPSTYALAAMLKDKEVSAVLSAAQALSRMGKGKLAVDTLVATLKHNDLYRRRRAAEILETIGSDARDAAPALLYALNDANGWMTPKVAAMEAAARAIGVSEETLRNEAIPFQNDNWIVRWRAARALGKIDPQIATDKVVPVLIKMLSHDQAWVRQMSAQTLGTIGKPAQAAIRPLQVTLANDKSQAVCKEAHEALKLIRQKLPTTRPARSDGLLARFAADGNAADSAGANHGGIVGNITFAADRHGVACSALAFNRNGGRVVIPDSDQLDTDDEFTLSVWLIRTHDSTRSGQIITKWQDTTREGDYALSMTGAGQACIMVANSTPKPQQDHIYSNTLAPKGKWTHVAATFDRGEIKLYINGIFDAGKTSTRIKHTDWKEYEHDEITIGALWEGKWGFRGAIDDVRIYGRALSASEIHALVGGPPSVTRNTRADRIVLKDGGIIAGTITNTRYVVTTAMGKITIPAARVAGFISRGDKIKGLQLLLTDSQVISGMLNDQTLQVDGPSGKTLKIPLGTIAQCGYRITQAKPARFASKDMMLVLRNGDRLAGAITTKLQLKSPYSLIDLPPESIVRIDAAEADKSLHRVVLVNASRVSGVLMPQTLAVKLQLGPKLDIKRENLAVLSRAGVKRGAAPANAILMRMTNGDCLLGRLPEKTVAVRTEFGNIAVAWTAVQSIRPDSGKGLHVLKMRTGAVHRGQLGGPHLSFEIAGTKRAIKVKIAQVSSIAPLGKLSPKRKD